MMYVLLFQDFSHKYNVFFFVSGGLFQRMFPDSEIATKFQCGEKKAAYLTVHGTAPHFRQLLTNRVRTANEFVLLFDESLNRKTRNKQFDIHIRLWDNDCVVTRYLTSDFMGHATSDDMVESFHKTTAGLKLQSCLQLSMDGPAVNWKFFDKIQKELKKDYSCSLLNLGSCGLHTVHGMYQHGIVATTWNLDQLLKNAFWLFKDTPTRRSDYEKSLVAEPEPWYPLKFCKTRWVENLPVAQRLVHVLPYLRKYVDAAEGGAVPKPDTQPYKIVKDWCKNDILLEAQLAFYISVTKEVTPFLKLYQTDKPMVTFLAQDLFELLKSLMQRFVKPDVMKKATTCSKLLDIKVKDSKSLLAPAKVHIGFTTENIIKELVSKKKISERQDLQFRMECRDCLSTTVSRLFEKSPLNHGIVKSLRCLNPKSMVTENEDTNVSRMKKLLQVFVGCGHHEESSCDDVISQYKFYMREEIPLHKSDFSQFDKATDRVDSLFHKTMHAKVNYIL